MTKRKINETEYFIYQTFSAFVIDNTTWVVFFALTVFKTKGCAYIAMKIIEKFFLEKTFPRSQEAC